MIQAFVQTDPQRLRYIDITAATLDQQGKPLPDIYVEDNLHFNEKGYDLITPLIKQALRKDPP